jgi:hypothetical protein
MDKSEAQNSYYWEKELCLKVIQLTITHNLCSTEPMLVLFQLQMLSPMPL